jgi:hypothetical protein
MERRQKMMRQRQLALEKQRNASRTAIGIMANVAANQDLPAAAGAPQRQKQGLSALLASLDASPTGAAPARKEPALPQKEAARHDTAAGTPTALLRQDEKRRTFGDLDGIDVEVLRAATPPRRERSKSQATPTAGGWDLTVDAPQPVSSRGLEEQDKAKRKGWRPWKGKENAQQQSPQQQATSSVDEVTMLSSIQEEERRSPILLVSPKNSGGWGGNSPKDATPYKVPNTPVHEQVQSMPGRMSTPDADREPQHFSRPRPMLKAPSAGGAMGFEDIHDILTDSP